MKSIPPVTYRQGDVFLHQIPALPTDAKPVESKNRLDEWMANAKPQALTARNAIASTVGLTGEQYAPVMES